MLRVSIPLADFHLQRVDYLIARQHHAAANGVYI
jgi:hypothetical protein